MAGVDDDIMKTRTTFLLGNIKLNSLHIGLDFVKCLRLKIFLLDAFYVLFFLVYWPIFFVNGFPFPHGNCTFWQVEFLCLVCVHFDWMGVFAQRFRIIYVNL